MKKFQRIQENSRELNESGRIREYDRTRKNQKEFYIIRENPREILRNTGES